MSRALLRIAMATVRGWTRAYTRGVRATIREARRQEVDSDLWESEHDPDAHGRSLPIQIVVRLIIGMVDDMRWRFEHVERAPGRSRRRVAIAVTGGVLALVIVLAVMESRPTPLPALPQLQLGQRMLLVKRGPPPPPPPPPPCAPKGLPGPQTDCTR